MLPFLAALLASSLYAASTTVDPSSAVAVDSLAALETAGPGFDLSENTLAAIAPEDPKPEEYGKWHGDVSFGATVATGNTERTTFSTIAKVMNRREKDRRSAEFLWNYTEEDDHVTERRVYGAVKYDYFATEKLYYLGQLSGEYNASALLDLRIILAAGAGYQFKETKEWKFAGEGGLAYIDEDYKVDASDAEYLALRLAYKADYNPNEKLGAGQTAELFPSLENSDDVTGRLDTHVKYTLSEKLFAQFQWLYTWDNTPAPGTHHTDNLFLLMIGWGF